MHSFVTPPNTNDDSRSLILETMGMRFGLRYVLLPFFFSDLTGREPTALLERENRAPRARESGRPAPGSTGFATHPLLPTGPVYTSVYTYVYLVGLPQSDMHWATARRAMDSVVAEVHFQDELLAYAIEQQDIELGSHGY